MRTTAIMLWEHPFDRVIPRWLGRVDIPTLIVWGDEDRLLPAELAPAWAALLPERDGEDVPGRRPPRARRVSRRGRGRRRVLRRADATQALLLDVGYVIIDVTVAAVDASSRATGRSMPEP